MKKLVVLLCMITCVFGLTACGKEKEELAYNKEAVEAASDAIYNLVSAEYEDSFMEQLNAYDKFQWEMIEANWRQEAGLKTTGKAIMEGIQSYAKARPELGNVIGTTGKTYKADKDSLVVNVSIDGELHDAEVELIFDKDLIVTNITTNVEYTFAEQMEKAALNTLMGMGTVFSVLILIMFIISAFTFIAKAEAKSAAKDKQKGKAETPVDNTIAQIIQNEEVNASDDLELAAVIAAAIAASEGKASVDGFVVRSIRKR